MLVRFNLLKNQIYQLIYWRFLFLTYVRIVLLACSYLNLSKNSSLNTSVSKEDAKVRLIFELPKIFRSFFSKKIFFEAVRFKTSSLFSISTHLRFSLESGCKITALRHILQTSATLFSYFFAVFPLSHWFSKDAVEQIFKASIPVNKTSYLNIYTRARIYRGFPETTCISYTGEDKLQIHNK